MKSQQNRYEKVTRPVIVAILEGPFLTLSTDGKALPNINQIPVFAAGANINTQPKPQPAIQFEPSPIKFGSRKISKEPVRIQTPQAEPERVRSQQVHELLLTASKILA